MYVYVFVFESAMLKPQVPCLGYVFSSDGTAESLKTRSFSGGSHQSTWGGSKLGTPTINVVEWCVMVFNEDLSTIFKFGKQTISKWAMVSETM